MEKWSEEVPPAGDEDKPLQIRRRPIQIVTIDWRSEICQFLKLPNDVSDNEIFEGLENIDGKIRNLEEQQNGPVKTGPPRGQLVFHIKCHGKEAHERNSFYLDVPWIVESGQYGAHLASSRHIRSMELYLERNKDVSFLVIREFACCKGSVPWKSSYDGKTSEEDLSHFFSGEYLDIVSDETLSALEVLSESALKEIDHPKFVDNRFRAIAYPYLWWYHSRHEIETAKAGMASNFQIQINLLQDYMEDRLKKTWDSVEEMTARGMITAELLRYIFRPNWF